MFELRLSEGAQSICTYFHAAAKIYTIHLYHKRSPYYLRYEIKRIPWTLRQYSPGDASRGHFAFRESPTRAHFPQVIYESCGVMRGTGNLQNAQGPVLLMMLGAFDARAKVNAR